MRTPHKSRWFVAAVVVSWWSCGGAFSEGSVGPTGGTVCLDDNRVCITVPSGGLADFDTLRITPGGEAPPAALSESFDISSTARRKVTFLQPATVSIAISTVDASANVPNEILRVYTKDENGEWVSLAHPTLDRVLGVVRGEVSHLSPFVILRADRLPDGGLPVDIDSGVKDSGVIHPPFDAGIDAGRPDAGRPDAGRPDAGRDSGMPDAAIDSGVPDAAIDSGLPDAAVDSGLPDAAVDSGLPDASVDSGLPDAGAPDAGVDAGVDAGETDAGQPDAGESDAGQPDAGLDDAGVDAG